MQVNKISLLDNYNSVVFGGKKEKVHTPDRTENSSGFMKKLGLSAAAAVFLLPVLKGCRQEEEPLWLDRCNFPVEVVVDGKRDRTMYNLERDSMFEVKDGTYHMLYNGKLMFKKNTPDSKWTSVDKIKLSKGEIALFDAICAMESPFNKSYSNGDVLNLMASYESNDLFADINERIPQTYITRFAKLSQDARELSMEIRNIETGDTTSMKVMRSDNLATKDIININGNKYISVVGVGNTNLGKVYQKFYIELGMRFKTSNGEYRVTNDGKLQQYALKDERINRIVNAGEVMHTEKNDTNWIDVENNEIPMVIGEMEVICNLAKLNDDNKDTDLWWSTPVLSKKDFKAGRNLINKKGYIRDVNPNQQTKEATVNSHVFQVVVIPEGRRKPAGAVVLADK